MKSKIFNNDIIPSAGEEVEAAIAVQTFSFLVMASSQEFECSVRHGEQTVVLCWPIAMEGVGSAFDVPAKSK